MPKNIVFAVRQCSRCVKFLIAFWLLLSFGVPAFCQDKPEVGRIEPLSGRSSQYEAHKLGPIFSQARVIPEAESHSASVDIDPETPPLPKGPSRPWTSIGKPTSVNQPRRLNGGGPGDPSDFTIDWQVKVNTSAWETNVASAGNVLLFTANYGDAFSGDRGRTFVGIDPFGFMADLPGGYASAFCCDQVVQYVPQIDRFIWVLQQNPVNNANVYRIAYASPTNVQATNGKVWNKFDLTQAAANVTGSWFDYPEIAVGSTYLYLACNLVAGPNGGKGLIARIPLASFQASGSGGSPMGGEYVVVDRWNHRPVQSAFQAEAIFAGLKSDSELEMIGWDQRLRTVIVPIHTITEDFESTTPNGNDWLGSGVPPQDCSKPPFIGIPPSCSKYSAKVFGATEVDNNTIWVAWSAGRDSLLFAQPHIEGAVLDSVTLKLTRQFLIYSTDYAYAYPTLATSTSNEVGITFAIGGGSISPNWGIGFLTPDTFLWTIESGIGKNLGAGGHYLGIRPTPDSPCFAATGNVTVSSTEQDAYLVLFGRLDGPHCTPVARSGGPTGGAGGSPAGPRCNGPGLPPCWSPPPGVRCGSVSNPCRGTHTNQ